LERLFEAPKGAGGERDGSFEKVKDGAHGYSDEPEGKKKQPHERVEDESQKSDGPANHEQNEPEKKFYHGNTSQRLYDKFRGKVYGDASLRSDDISFELSAVIRRNRG
jgi:hypothetical protein